jgi:hypothetical protein
MPSGIGEVSSKWTKLKEKYTRERKLIVKAPSGSAATPKSTWPLYESMNFFSSSIQTRKEVVILVSDFLFSLFNLLNV